MQRLSAHDTRRLAVDACVHPATIAQYFRGNARSTTSARITQALVRWGRHDLVVAPVIHRKAA